MRGKWHQCTDCGKNLATYHSLWRHKKSCKSIPRSLPVSEYGNGKREKGDERIFNNLIGSHQRNSIPVASKQNGGFMVEKDGKTESLLDAIINGSIPKYNELDRPIVKKRKLSVDAVEPSFLMEPIEKPILVTKHKPGFPFESPISKADTIDEDDVESDTETIDITDLPAPHQNVKFLPKTVEDLRRKFEEVITKIAINRKGGVPEKTCDRNEAVFLLDELLRQDGISHRMYRQYNDLLADSPPNIGSGITPTGGEEESNDEEEMALSAEDQIKKDITATADYLIQHDKKELQELVAGIEKDKDIIDTVLSLEELLNIYLEQEFLERDGDAIDGKIIELVNSLSHSKNISKASLIKIKMLINDIERNRQRVKSIVNRFSQAGDDRDSRLWIIKQLAKENLVTEHQYLRLIEEIEELDIKRFIDIIKEFKIGEGFDFLPRKTNKLVDTLQEWLDEFVEKGSSALKNKIGAVLNELLRRKEISPQRYDEIKGEHNIS